MAKAADWYKYETKDIAPDYHVSDPAATRHRVLNAAVEEDGYEGVRKHFQYRHNQMDPETHTNARAVIAADLKWLKERRDDKIFMVHQSPKWSL